MARNRVASIAEGEKEDDRDPRLEHFSTNDRKWSRSIQGCVRQGRGRRRRGSCSIEEERVRRPVHRGIPPSVGLKTSRRNMGVQASPPVNSRNQFMFRIVIIHLVVTTAKVFAARAFHLRTTVCPWKMSSRETFRCKRDVLPSIFGDVFDCRGADLCSDLATRCHMNRINSPQADAGTYQGRSPWLVRVPPPLRTM